FGPNRVTESETGRPGVRSNRNPHPHMRNGPARVVAEGWRTPQLTRDGEGRRAAAGSNHSRDRVASMNLSYRCLRSAAFAVSASLALASCVSTPEAPGTAPVAALPAAPPLAVQATPPRAEV